MAVSTWVDVLDHLESDARRAEQDPESLPASWQPPADLGALPAELTDRAGRLVVRQQELLRVLATRLGATAQHQSLVEVIDSRTTHHQHRPPVYIDVSA